MKGQFFRILYSLGIVFLIIGCNDDEITPCALALNCDFNSEVIGEIISEEGMVHFIDSLNTYYISYRQFPAQGIGVTCNLPDNLKVDSTMVMFSGNIRNTVTSEYDAQQQLFGWATIHRSVHCLELTNVYLHR